METEIEGRERFDAQALELLDRLRELNFDVYWNKKWRQYEIIEREIAESNFLLAIVDLAWRGSTWMAIEVTRANGEAAWVKDNPRMTPIPIFIYPVDDSWQKCFLVHYKSPVLLDRDVGKAVQKICSQIGWPNERVNPSTG